MNRFGIGVLNFSRHLIDVIKKRERKTNDQWHLDEMAIKLNGVVFLLWRIVYYTGHEQDVLLQKHRNKK